MKKLFAKNWAWNPVLLEMFVNGSFAASSQANRGQAETNITATHCGPKISLRTAMNFT